MSATYFVNASALRAELKTTTTKIEILWQCDLNLKRLYTIYSVLLVAKLRKFSKLLTISKALIYNIKDSFIDITDGALFYHAHYVTPAWSKVKYRTARIGDHIFYRWDIN